MDKGFNINNMRNKVPGYISTNNTVNKNIKHTKYTKEIDGENVIKTGSQITVKKGNFVVANPTEEMILADGWSVYAPPVIDLPYEEKLQEAKNVKLREITSYDSSENVNSFYINDVSIWLDKATRTGLMLRFQSELALGDTTTTLWYNDMEFVLPLDVATQMLYALEKYASQCYDNTKRHMSRVNSMNEVESVNNYDFTTGYPEKLRFNN